MSVRHEIAKVNNSVQGVAIK